MDFPDPRSLSWVSYNPRPRPSPTLLKSEPADNYNLRSIRAPTPSPVENIWQFMRDNWLSNRVFKSYDDILDHCCFAWNKLIDMPWKIMSIGSRDWAYRW
jgi:hypothetical protein